VSAHASFEALTPTAFLDRSAEVFADRVAVIDGDEIWTYAQFADRCLRQAGLLAGLGLAPGDRVAVLAPNGHVLLESHYGVLYAGMVLVALNTRLSADELRYIIGHADCRAVIVDESLAELALAAVGEDLAGRDYRNRIRDIAPERASGPRRCAG
jgi:fatty-acyl-CoA synthase